MKKIIRIVRGGEGVVLFPEGTRSLDGQLQRGKSGIGLIIAKTRSPVQPMRIFGSYEAFPKQSSNSSESDSSKITLTPITVVLGEPIRFSDAELDPANHGGDERALYQYLADRVMAAIGKLEIPN